MGLIEGKSCVLNVAFFQVQSGHAESGMQNARTASRKNAICPAGGGRALSPAVRKQAIVLKERRCRQGANVSRSLSANGPRSRMPDISAFPNFGLRTLDFGLLPLNNRGNCVPPMPGLATPWLKTAAPQYLCGHSPAA